MSLIKKLHVDMGRDDDRRKRRQRFVSSIRSGPVRENERKCISRKHPINEQEIKTTSFEWIESRSVFLFSSNHRRRYMEIVLLLREREMKIGYIKWTTSFEIIERESFVMRLIFSFFHHEREIKIRNIISMIVRWKSDCH